MDVAKIIREFQAIFGITATERKWLTDQITAALPPAQEWQDISTAPMNKRIGLLIDGVEHIGRWEDDRYAQKPRPYWQHETFGRLHVSDQRKEQPTMWRELRTAVIAEEWGEK